VQPLGHSELRVLRLSYETAYAAYQQHIVAVTLAQGEDEGVPEELLRKTARALHDLRLARRRYRDALVAPGARDA
jgi:hypothetical protein